MASSSYCFALRSVAVVLSFLLVSASATKYIDAICRRATNKAFCVKTLNAFPPAASATSTFQAAEATLRLTMYYARKSAAFAGKAQLTATQDAFVTIYTSLKSAALELKESPDSANYDVMVCTDSTRIVKNLVGKNTDKASRTVMMMALMMEKLLAIAVGATVAVGG